MFLTFDMLSGKRGSSWNHQLGTLQQNDCFYRYVHFSDITLQFLCVSSLQTKQVWVFVSSPFKEAQNWSFSSMQQQHMVWYDNFLWGRFLDDITLFCYYILPSTSQIFFTFDVDICRNSYKISKYWTFSCMRLTHFCRNWFNILNIWHAFLQVWLAMKSPA